MATKTTVEEHRFLVDADNDIALHGKTEKKCPRCGNEIVIEDHGSAYAVKCKTNNCIKAEFRGI